MVFEDMQWADPSLLDFVEYLLEWSRDHPLYVITLARPELVDAADLGREPDVNSIYLEPLAGGHGRAADGLVPGLPMQLRERILARAEGVPLYAVETVRMLLDRGLLVQEGSSLPAGRTDRHARGAGDAAGADRGPPGRPLGARSGGFCRTPRSSARPSRGRRWRRSRDTRRRARAAARGLVRKEVLSIQADPRSPEHGQYGFLQDLVRAVAYETLSKRERRRDTSQRPRIWSGPSAGSRR